MDDISMVEKNEIEIQELVVRAQNGDRDSVGTLFEIFSDRIYRFLLIRVSGRETAEDLAQSVFIEMIQSLHRYRPRSNVKFSTWLFQIARFRLIDHYRKNGHAPIPLDNISNHPVTDGHGDPVENMRVERALQQLPENYQTVIRLRFQEGFSPKETAQIMRTTAVNVRVLQFRALKALKKLLS